MLKMAKRTEEISKKISFAELMKKKPEAAKVLAEAGMFCLGCPMAMQETLEQGCLAHGIDADELVKKLNKKK